MTQEEVIKKLCELCSVVGRAKFDSHYAHDCFCGENPLKIGGYQFSEEIMHFIEEAVEEKLNA